MAKSGGIDSLIQVQIENDNPRLFVKIFQIYAIFKLN